MNAYLGVVTKVEDPNKFVIRATIPGWVEDVIAYPDDTFDEPNIDDPVILEEIETVFGYCFLWKKQRHYDHTRMKLGDQLVDITKDRITITSGMDESDLNDNSNLADSDEGIKIATKKTRTIEIDADGELVVHSGEDATINIDKNCEVKIKGNLDLDVDGDIDIKGRNINLKAMNSLQIDTPTGMVVPTGKGPFISSVVCPYFKDCLRGNRVM